MSNRNNYESICTECQLETGDPEAHCYKQNGRECYLDQQEENAGCGVFENLHEFLSEE